MSSPANGVTAKKTLNFDERIGEELGKAGDVWPSERAVVEAALLDWLEKSLPTQRKSIERRNAYVKTVAAAATEELSHAES